MRVKNISKGTIRIFDTPLKSGEVSEELTEEQLKKFSSLISAKLLVPFSEEVTVSDDSTLDKIELSEQESISSEPARSELPHVASIPEKLEKESTEHLSADFTDETKSDIPVLDNLPEGQDLDNIDAEKEIAKDLGTMIVKKGKGKPAEEITLPEYAKRKKAEINKVLAGKFEKKPKSNEFLRMKWKITRSNDLKFLQEVIKTEKNEKLKYYAEKRLSKLKKEKKIF